MEEDAVGAFHYYGPLHSGYRISSLFRENNNVVVFPSFSHLHVVGHLVVHLLSRIDFHPKDKKFP